MIMSKKKRKYKQKDIRQEVLKELLSCSACGDIGEPPKKERDDIDYLLENLPGVGYVSSRLVNYIFSNGLTTGDVEKDEILNDWLYAQRNKEGSSNYHVLREVIKRAALYGECGLRMYQGMLYAYERGKYGILLSQEEGIDNIIGYFIRKDGKEIEEVIDLNKYKYIGTYDDIIRFFEERDLIFLSSDEFRNIRNDTSKLHGICPFVTDRQRVDLLLSTYERMNYDIEYDGPGRIIVRPKDGYSDAGDNDISTGTVLSEVVKDNYEQAKAEIKRVAREIKNSTSDSVIALSNAFDKDITHLPRVTKSTEFFDWQSHEVEIIAQIMGMSPTLIETGHIYGNVSVAAIIDNSMLNTIIPMRESYAVQFSELISSALNLPKVYFNKYDLAQVQDENVVRHEVAEIIRNLSTAIKNSGGDDELRRVMDDYAKYLGQSIYDTKGNMDKL